MGPGHPAATVEVNVRVPDEFQIAGTSGVYPNNLCIHFSQIVRPKIGSQRSPDLAARKRAQRNVHAYPDFDFQYSPTPARPLFP